MVEPLFPTRPISSEMTNTVFVIEPYRHEGAWVFDDARVGLQREPFVSGITEMIDHLVSGIPGAERGFRLLFAVNPFEGYQTTLEWVRSRSEEHTSELQSLRHLVCRLLLEKK